MNKFYSLALILLGFVLTSQVAAKSPPPGTGKADMPANILFMVDTSGSMGATVPPSGGRPFDVAVDSNGYIYTADATYHKVNKTSQSGDLVWSVGGY